MKDLKSKELRAIGSRFLSVLGTKIMVLDENARIINNSAEKAEMSLFCN